MSFWAGLARGFADADAKKEREATRADAEAERKEAARRWELDHGLRVDELKANREYRQSEAERNQSQFDLNYKLKEDELKISRATKLLDGFPPGLANGLSGDPTSTPTSGEGSKTLSPESMTEGSALFQAEFKNLEEDTQKSEFFQAAAQSPGAQATIMAFVEAQAKKGNTVDLASIPKYFKYLGAVKGKNEAEAKEFLASLLSGEVDLSDPDTFIEGMMVMRNYKPTQQLFIQTDSPTSLDDASKQLPIWENAVEVDAYRALPNLTGDEEAEVQRALGMLERKENRTQGLDILAKYGYGSGAVKQYNMEDNPVIRSYYGGGEPQAAPTEPQAAVTQVRPEDVTVFKDWDEVNTARAEGFAGKASVGGVTYAISPLEASPVAAEGPGPETPPPAVEGTGESVNKEGFLGTGYIAPQKDNMDTDIDRLFNEASNLDEAAVEAPPVKETRRIEETPDVDLEGGAETLSDVPDTFESPEEFEKSVDFVLEEMEELGIRFPTTNIELSEFKDDLKELVYEMGADIPVPVLQEVIKRATDNAKGGLSVTGTAMDANETGRGQGGNPEDTPIGTQLKNMADRMGITEPDIKKRKRKPEPAPELNRSEVSRLKRAIASGDEGILNNLVEKYGEEKIAEVVEGLGL